MQLKSKASYEGTQQHYGFKTTSVNE